MLQRVVHRGRTLPPHSSLVVAGVTPGATLELLPRLCGGGGDGGSTGAESRSCYLEMYLGKKPDKVCVILMFAACRAYVCSGQCEMAAAPHGGVHVARQLGAALL